MASVLVCDDDRSIVRAIQITLEQEGFTVITAYDGQEALDRVKEGSLDCSVVDVMMPKMDGLRLIEVLRNDHNHLPILILSAKSQAEDRVKGLDLGGDDYLVKPFESRELVARVRSLIRRSQTYSQDLNTGRMVLGDLMIDHRQRRVFVFGQEVKLTLIEYDILYFLASHPNRIFSSTQIYEKVWKEAALGYESTVAVHIRHIREKIEINPKDPRYIKVVWGLGYKMEGDHDEK